MKSTLYIISRFNIYIPHFREMAGLTDENYVAWCKERVELFRKYTLPSVLNQDFKGYKWLIWFDTELNSHISELIAELKDHSRVVPLFHNNRASGGGGSFTDAVRKHITETTPGDTDYVCTTRLDTDDAISKTFMGELHSAISKATRAETPSETFAFNFPFGAQLAGNCVYSYMYEFSPFVSVVCKFGKEKKVATAFDFPHYDLGKHMPVHQVIKQLPQWLQIIHAGNAANTLKEGLPQIQNYEEIISNFNADVSVKASGDTGA